MLLDLGFVGQFNTRLLHRNTDLNLRSFIYMWVIYWFFGFYIVLDICYWGQTSAVGVSSGLDLVDHLFELHV